MYLAPWRWRACFYFVVRLSEMKKCKIWAIKLIGYHTAHKWSTSFTVAILLWCICFPFIDKSNSVPFVIDIFEYQSIGVNFSKGYGVQKLGGMAEFGEYKFNVEENHPDLPTSSMLMNLFVKYKGVDHFYMDPGYPLFLGTIYTLFGVNPFTVKCIQLFMLCIVAACLPLIGHFYWGKKGWVCGFFGAMVFLYTKYEVAGFIMTESLNLFSFFLILVSYIYFEKRQNLISVFLFSLALAFAIFIKGVALFIPVIILFLGFLKAYKTKNKILFKNLLLTALFIVVVLSPWLVYSNKVNMEWAFDPTTFKDELLTREYCVECEEYIMNSSLPMTEKEYIINRNFNLQIEPIHGINDIYEFDYFIADMLANIMANKSFFFISIKHHQLMLATNNEYLLQRDKRPHLWRLLPESFYLNDGMENRPDILRVFNFYLNHPKLIVLHPLYKISYFLVYPFGVLFFLILWTIDNWVTFFVREKKSKKRLIALATGLGLVTVGVYLFTVQFVTPNLITFPFGKYLYVLVLVTFLFIPTFILGVYYNSWSTNFLQKLPISFWAIILNIVIISILVVGIYRLTSLLNIIFPLILFLYVMSLLSKYRQSFNRLFYGTK